MSCHKFVGKMKFERMLRVSGCSKRYSSTNNTNYLSWQYWFSNQQSDKMANFDENAALLSDKQAIEEILQKQKETENTENSIENTNDALSEQGIQVSTDESLLQKLNETADIVANNNFYAQAILDGQNTKNLQYLQPEGTNICVCKKKQCEIVFQKHMLFFRKFAIKIFQKKNQK